LLLLCVRWSDGSKKKEQSSRAENDKSNLFHGVASIAVISCVPFVTSGEVIPSADWSPVDDMRIQSFFTMLVRVDLGVCSKELTSPATAITDCSVMRVDKKSRMEVCHTFPKLKQGTYDWKGTAKGFTTVRSIAGLPSKSRGERADRFNLFCTDFLGNELIMRNPSFRLFADTIKEVFADLAGAKVIVG
jgi:hypothetical protein